MSNVAQNTEGRPFAARVSVEDLADAKASERRQRERAWTMLDLATIEAPTDIGNEIREQVAWLSAFDHQTADGHELRAIDLDGAVDELRALATDIDQMANAYEYATDAQFRTRELGCTLAPEHGNRLGLSIREIAHRVVDEFKKVAAGASRADLHHALSSLASLSLETDALGSWFGSEAPESEEEPASSPRPSATPFARRAHEADARTRAWAEEYATITAAVERGPMLEEGIAPLLAGAVGAIEGPAIPSLLVEVVMRCKTLEVLAGAAATGATNKRVLEQIERELDTLGQHANIALELVNRVYDASADVPADSQADRPLDAAAEE